MLFGAILAIFFDLSSFYRRGIDIISIGTTKKLIEKIC